MCLFLFSLPKLTGVVLHNLMRVFSLLSCLTEPEEKLVRPPRRAADLPVRLSITDKDKTTETSRKPQKNTPQPVEYKHSAT